MKKKAVICLACGSSSVERVETISSAQLTLGPEFTFNEIYFKCKSCGEEADFHSETDKTYLAAQKKAQAIFVKKTIDQLSKLGIKMAYFERVFELPARTLTRWKSGDFSSSAIALLRIVKTYHWITEVADQKFEGTFARQVLVKEALSIFKQSEAALISSQSLEVQSGVTPNFQKIGQAIEIPSVNVGMSALQTGG